MNDNPNRSWFFCPDTYALFVGYSGREYPDSYELEEIPDWIQSDTTLRNHANDMVMKHINPYKDSLNLKTGITIYYKEIW